MRKSSGTQPQIPAQFKTPFELLSLAYPQIAKNKKSSSKKNKTTENNKFICQSISKLQKHYYLPISQKTTIMEQQKDSSQSSESSQQESEQIDFSRFSLEQLKALKIKALNLGTLYKYEIRKIPSLFEAQISRQKKQINQKLAQISTLYPIPKQISKDNLNLKIQVSQDLDILVRHSDLITLLPNCDVNGWMVNTHIETMLEKMIPESTKQSVHYFNTYFFQILGRGIFGQDMPKEKLSHKVANNYWYLKKCRQHVKIFDKEILIIPIHKTNQQWAVVVVYNLSSLFSKEKSQNKTPVSILYFDSQKVKDPLVVDMIKLYLQLQYEYGYKNSDEFVEIDINFETLPDYQLMVPRQTNSRDSAIYALANVESILFSPSVLQTDMSIPHNRDFLKLYSHEFVLSLRSRIINFYVKLHLQNDQFEIQQIRRQFVNQFLNERQKVILKGLKQNDYDKIDQNILLAFQQYSHQSVTNQEQNMSLRIMFHLSKSCNYFERVKPSATSLETYGVKKEE